MIFFLGSGINYALRGLAEQSSTYRNNDAGRVVDGSRDFLMRHGSCSHTNKELNPWLRVELDKIILVTEVMLVNRGDDCCCEILFYIIKKSNWNE